MSATGPSSPTEAVTCGRGPQPHPLPFSVTAGRGTGLGMAGGLNFYGYGRSCRNTGRPKGSAGRLCAGVGMARSYAHAYCARREAKADRGTRTAPTRNEKSYPWAVPTWVPERVKLWVARGLGSPVARARFLSSAVIFFLALPLRRGWARSPLRSNAGVR